MGPDEARAAMVERLRADGRLRSAAVEVALLAVPRHHFVDGVTIEAAYADSAVLVKTDDRGRPISSLSQPTMVTVMLELAELESGHRVLEVGTGTGYNAALLASIVGAEGHVVSVELDADLADAARDRLHRHGLGSVEVVVGDGADGFAGAAPYDRIVVTAGAGAVSDAWVDQLRPGGRLIVPIVDARGIGKVHCLVHTGSELEDVATVPCGFLPLRAPTS